jgi:hypothetical protein
VTPWAAWPWTRTWEARLLASRSSPSVSAISSAEANSSGMTSNSGVIAPWSLAASSTKRSIFTIEATLLPKPVMIRLLLLPTGMICCVFASVNIVRIEFDSVRTSVFGRSITVVTSVAGWSAKRSMSSEKT